MTKPVCPNCMKVDYGAILPSDHGGRFYSTRCGNCNHRFSYNYQGVVSSGHEEPRPSKTLSIPDGELWSLVRSLISQGTYIQMDASAGKYQTSEEVFMRIDEAAREKADEIEAKYSAHEPFHSLASEPSAANSGQCESRKTAQSGTGAGLSPPPSAVLVNAFRAGAFYGCAEEFNPLDLQRDAEAYGSRHSPTKSGEV
jgi:hypothetical protein